MPIPLILLLILLTCAAGAALYFHAVVRLRDRVFSPEERNMGRGLRKALLIVQPSRRGKGDKAARRMAEALAAAGYAVTMNRPSAALEYDPMEYDFLVFGGSAYLGRVGKPLVDYLSGLRFRGKKVLLYVLGEAANAPELATLRLCVPGGNTIRTIKVKANEMGKLAEFAIGA